MSDPQNLLGAQNQVGSQNLVGAQTAAAVTVNEPGAGNRLAGPGTGRAVSQPTDARVERHTSFDPRTSRP